MKKILVTEDEPEIRELLGNYLTHEGYDVTLAEDGVEAVSQFSKGNFDLVILDIMIPKIDGFGVCEVIKKQSDILLLRAFSVTLREVSLRTTLPSTAIFTRISLSPYT